MSVADIVELNTEDEMREAFPVMRLLRPHLNEEGFLALVRAMRPDGYRLFALRDGDGIVALAGIAVRTNLYDLRHVWVYDLVTREDARSRGHGGRLLRFLEEVARREGCVRVALSSGFPRTGAHRFYEAQQGYERCSYVFRKRLDGPHASD